jgi:hypothetical protein
MKKTAVLAAAALAVAVSTTSLAQNDSPFSYAEHTPGARLVAEGKRSFEAGQYASALSKYEAAARWADKFAQFNIGVMHLQGKGTDFDPARALAWFQLAAERDYPMMVTMVEDLEDMVDDATKRKAERIRVDELEPVFGDDVAIERTQRRMQRDRRLATGSRLGFAGFLRVIDSNGFSRDGAEFYAEEKWDFRQIVAIETQRMMDLGDGRVELRELELDDESEQP